MTNRRFMKRAEYLHLHIVSQDPNMNILEKNEGYEKQLMFLNTFYPNFCVNREEKRKHQNINCGFV